MKMGYKKNKGFIFLLFSLAFMVVFHSVAYAAQCSSTFSGLVVGVGANSKLDIDCASTINYAGTVLPFNKVDDQKACRTTCQTDACGVTGESVPAYSPGAFQVSSKQGGNVILSGTATLGSNNSVTDYDKITVNADSNVTFSANPNGVTTYRIATLTVGTEATLNLPAGDYWINDLNVSGATSKINTINVIGSGTVRLWINTTFDPPCTLNWNANGAPSKLLVYGYQHLHFNSGASIIHGVIYGRVHVLLKDHTVVTGAIASNHVEIHDQSIVNTDSTSFNNMDFGGTCESSITKFSVIAPATGTNCQNIPVTVTAQNNQNQTQPNYTGVITLTTQSGTGTWFATSGTGFFSAGDNNGVATYDFSEDDNGVVTFQLAYPANGISPITVKAFQSDNSAIEGFSQPISFIPTSLLVTATPVLNPPAAIPPAFSSNQISAGDFTLYLTAYTPSTCGIISSYTDIKNLRFWTNFVNPAGGSLNARVNGATVANSIISPVTTQNINFTNGVATITMNYPDVGMINLNVQDTASGGPAGQSGSFVVKPAQFAIHIPGNTASQIISPSIAANAACLSDNAFKKAGNNFTVNVQAQNILGNVTPNYGNEIPSQGISIVSSGMVGPITGRNGSNNDGLIVNGSNFIKISNNSGPFVQAPYFTGNNFSFDEVGCINLIASVGTGSYLGAGNVISSLVVGRFIPDHFDVSGNAPIFQTGNINSLGSFTYLDQPFSYSTAPVMTVTARSLGTTVTRNYTGNYWKLNNTGFNSLYETLYTPLKSTDVLPALTLIATLPNPNFVDNNDGTGTFTYSDNGGLKIARPTPSFAPPFTADLKLKVTTITDQDNVTCSGSGCVNGGFEFGSLITLDNGILFSGTGSGNGKLFYHGRLVLYNTYGSELLPLYVPIEAQYFTSADGFVINPIDSNSTVTALSIKWIPSPYPPGFSTTTSIIKNNFPVLSGNLVAGNTLNIQLSVPTASGVPATGYFDIELNLVGDGTQLPWLQFPWPYASSTPGAYVNPRARATFGIFQGNDRNIFQNEIFP